MKCFGRTEKLEAELSEKKATDSPGRLGFVLLSRGADVEVG